VKVRGGLDSFTGSLGLQGDFSEPSEYFSFTPPPPSSTEVPVAEKSCPYSGTGVITLNNISSDYSNYRYILRRGDVAELGCDPEAGDCIADVQVSGQNNGSQLVLSNIPPGTYSLFLLNNGGQQGVCPRRIGGAIVVEATPDLFLSTFTSTDITCHGANDGSVSVTIGGGRPATVSYTLTYDGGSISKSSTTPDASVLFESLPAGSFTLTVSDGCTPAVSRAFELHQPVKVNAIEFQRSPATCDDPGNGSLRINVARSTGPYDVSTSTLFQYHLFKGGESYSLQESPDPEYTWLESLPSGNDYQLIVTEKGSSVCNGYSETFSIDGNDPLGFAVLDMESVSCFEGDDGAVTVLGKGGIGDYVYSVSGLTESSTTGIFTDLRADDYYVTVKNNADCNDSFTALVEVTEPPRLTAALVPKDISCYGSGDGSVTAVVEGGTEGEGYVYTWETLFGDTWIQMSATGNSLEDLEEGDYRLRIKDANSCVSLSNDVRITEPEVVDLAHAAVVDIKCFGEKGNIVVNATGGVQPYTFEYTMDEGATYIPFTSDTPLEAGKYIVKVTDANGCADQHPEIHTLTHPDEPLHFTAMLSDYNGFNISCYGGSNGTATFSAQGGNGAHYDGYDYAVDDGTYQRDITVRGITAGNHILKVRDNRGCVVESNTLFTQTAEKLQPLLIKKEDVACEGDENGVLEITGTGGLAPYQYSMDGAIFQDQGRFAGLASGPYTIIVKDRNDCESNYENDILIINPPIRASFTIKDVSCHGGNDGTISAMIISGVSPFKYEWSGVSSNADVVEGLSKGSYTVKVTDDAACVREFAVDVDQPEQPLRINLNTVPVCYGRTDGIITAYVAGGTQPYEYSLDNGQHFGPEPLFLRGVGDYTVTSRDNKGCLITANTTIIQRNDRPDPNFLVSSKENARDTLVLTDISVPKPDSIDWIFSPAAVVLNDSEWAPEISFGNEGSYPVTMISYFQKCAYEVTKTIFLRPFDSERSEENIPAVRPITSMEVTPNPNNGTFRVTVQLNRKRNLSLIVYNVAGNILFHNSYEETDEVIQDVDISENASGVYLVRAVTETDAYEVRIVVNH